jgi:hypothetical protein
MNEIQDLIKEAIERENTLLGSLIAQFMQKHNLTIDEVCIVRQMTEEGCVVYPGLRKIYDKLPIVCPPED